MSKYIMENEIKGYIISEITDEPADLGRLIAYIKYAVPEVEVLSESAARFMVEAIRELQLLDNGSQRRH
jgi:hypothetical protein